MPLWYRSADNAADPTLEARLSQATPSKGSRLTCLWRCVRGGQLEVFGPCNGSVASRPAVLVEGRVSFDGSCVVWVDGIEQRLRSQQAGPSDAGFSRTALFKQWRCFPGGGKQSIRIAVRFGSPRRPASLSTAECTVIIFLLDEPDVRGFVHERLERIDPGDEDDVWSGMDMLGREPGLDGLGFLLQTSDQGPGLSLRVAAVQMLGELVATGAVPHLIRLIQDDSVAWAARNALDRIAGIAGRPGIEVTAGLWPSSDEFVIAYDRWWSLHAAEVRARLGQ